MNTIPVLNPTDYVMQSGDDLTTDSRKVAQAFGKRHGDVLRAIDKLECGKEFTERNFAFRFENSQLQNGKRNRYASMTKDGFMFLVMGFTGAAAAAMKVAFINAFNAMADFIRKHAQTAWQQYDEARQAFLNDKRWASIHGRGLRIWRDQAPEHHRTLALLHPQMPLALPN